MKEGKTGLFYKVRVEYENVRIETLVGKEVPQDY